MQNHETIDAIPLKNNSSLNLHQNHTLSTNSSQNLQNQNNTDSISIKSEPPDKSKNDSFTFHEHSLKLSEDKDSSIKDKDSTKDLVTDKDPDTFSKLSVISESDRDKDPAIHSLDKLELDEVHDSVGNLPGSASISNPNNSNPTSKPFQTAKERLGKKSSLLSAISNSFSFSGSTNSLNYSQSDLPSATGITNSPKVSKDNDSISITSHLTGLATPIVNRLSMKHKKDSEDSHRRESKSKDTDHEPHHRSSTLGGVIKTIIHNKPSFSHKPKSGHNSSAGNHPSGVHTIIDHKSEFHENFDTDTFRRLSDETENFNDTDTILSSMTINTYNASGKSMKRKGSTKLNRNFPLVSNVSHKKTLSTRNSTLALNEAGHDLNGMEQIREVDDENKSHLSANFSKYEKHDLQGKYGQYSHYYANGMSGGIPEDNYPEGDSRNITSRIYHKNKQLEMLNTSNILNQKLPRLPGIAILGESPASNLFLAGLKFNNFPIIFNKSNLIAYNTETSSQIDALLLDNNVEIVVISTDYPSQTTNLVMKTLGIGKNVILQAPICGTSQMSIWKCVEASRYYPQLLAISGFSLRLLPCFYAARRYLTQYKSLGQIRMVKVDLRGDLM